MNFLKLCLIFINPLTVSILLFVPLSNNSFGNEESVIPESNITGGDSSGGGNLGESVIPESDTTGGDSSGGGNLGESVIPESDTTQGILISEDGTITATPEIIARLDGIALSIISDLNSGTIRIVDSEGEIVEVSIDTQQIIGNILRQDSSAVDLQTAIEGVSFDNNSSSVTVTPIEIVESVFGTLGEDTIFVSDNEFDVTITYVDTDNSLNLKSTKIASSSSEIQTFRVKVVNKTTRAVATYTLRGSQNQVNSAASTITALTLAGADRKTIDTAKEIALESGIQPELLVNLMLNYEGLFDRDSSTNANSSAVAPILASNKQLSNSTLAQQKSIVDLTKFSDAIQAYNQAIEESKPEVYQTLSENSEFQVIGETLQRLRESL